MNGDGRWLSRAAILWALYEAADVPAHLLSTLIAVAAHTGNDGQGAYISAGTVGQLTRKTESQAKRNLRELEKLGHISRGNQRLVAHIRADRRPIVYDVPMPERGSADATSSRGSTHATPQAHGVAPTPSRGSTEGPHGVAPVLPEEFLKNSRTARGRASAENARADAPKTITAPPCPGCGKPFSQELLADPAARQLAMDGDLTHSSECEDRDGET